MKIFVTIDSEDYDPFFDNFDDWEDRVYVEIDVPFLPRIGDVFHLTPNDMKVLSSRFNKSEQWSNVLEWNDVFNDEGLYGYIFVKRITFEYDDKDEINYKRFILMELGKEE